MSQTPEAVAAQNHALLRTTCIILGIAPILAVLFMANHPTIQSHDVADAFAEMAQKANVSRIVHGILITVAAVQLFGFWGLSKSFGFHRQTVTGGFMVYAIGVLSVCMGGVINGFAVPMFESQFYGAPIERQELARQVLSYSWALNQSFVSVGVAAESIGILCWSAVMLRQSGTWRVIGGLGALVSIVTFGGIISGRLGMDFHGFGAVVLTQSIWTLSIALRLCRDAFRKPPTAA